MTDKFEMHCVVELFGHSQIAGKVTEQAIGGGTFIRVDVPKTSKREPFTKFYGAGAIFAITPVDETVAQAMAEALEVAPVNEWRLRAAEPARMLSKPDGTANLRHWWDGGDDDEPDLEDDEPRPGDHPGFEEIVGRDDDEGEPVIGPASTPDALSVLAGVEPDKTEMEKPKMESRRAGDKLAAARWARDLLAAEFVIVDTETTGFGPDDEIIQIGIIDQAGEVVLEQLIKPTKSITNTAYHGLTDESVQDAPLFPEAFSAIKAAMQGKKAVAYNWEYDSRMINQVCRRHKLPEWGSEGQCAMEMYAQFNGEWNDYHGNYRWKKLYEALAAFGLKHEDFGTKEHDACTDARATLALMRKMAEFEPEPDEEGDSTAL